MGGVSIQNLTRRRSVPRFAYTMIAREVLPGWDISLAFVGATRARALNKKLRGKDYIPNVLSYTLDDKSCEVIICPSEAAKQAPDFQLSASNFLLLLFIHGLLHIKGWAHGGTMEKCERKLLARFLPMQAGAKSGARANSYATTHRNRNRHRHVPSKGRRRRGARR